MTTQPDYATARDQTGFGWSVAGTQGALRELTGIPIRDFNLDPAVCIEAYHRGRPLLREMFGADVILPAPCTPAVSYGHVNCLGSELLFPEGGEVAHTHFCDSLDDAMRAVCRTVDFATTGMAPFYLKFLEQMQTAFPGETVGFGFGLEGPLTTAYELRGDGFFYDMLDSQDRVGELLEVLTDSIVEFHAFQARVTGVVPVSSHSGGLCDDLASTVPDRLWRELVLPPWEQYFSGITTGSRSAHVEDLRAAQLPYLEEAGLSFYDPSISKKLHPRIIATSCRVPFLWRLGSFHYTSMSCQDVADFVFQSAADGTSRVVTYVAEDMCNNATVPKVEAFIRAAREAKRLVEAGTDRKEIRQRISAEGRVKFWDNWNGYHAPGGATT